MIVSKFDKSPDFYTGAIGIKELPGFEVTAEIGRDAGLILTNGSEVTGGGANARLPEKMPCQAEPQGAVQPFFRRRRLPCSSPPETLYLVVSGAAKALARTK